MSRYQVRNLHISIMFPEIKTWVKYMNMAELLPEHIHIFQSGGCLVHLYHTNSGWMELYFREDEIMTLNAVKEKFLQVRQRVDGKSQIRSNL